MRSTGDIIKAQLIKNLPRDYPFGKLVGLLETSLGKMVPIMTLAELEKNPLMVYAEHYNTLMIDRIGFKSPIPDIKGLAPKDNIKAWVDCKAFIHNLGLLCHIFQRRISWQCSKQCRNFTERNLKLNKKELLFISSIR